jgi:hypothetical protein
MIRPNLEARVIAALALAPLTVGDLSKMLCSCYEPVRQAVFMCKAAGAVRVCGIRHKRNGRPELLCALATSAQAVGQ